MTLLPSPSNTDAVSGAYGADVLSIQHLLAAGPARSPSREIVYGETVRMDYSVLALRIGRLAAWPLGRWAAGAGSAARGACSKGYVLRGTHIT
ncbi:hypothetical protein [Variovorax sp. WS11]|uniref:hypothetical protein n=1 Tax=Variovorax sp. WS11 TaxID=1105204 RepID=UPI0011B208E8|nr:hypothetical protein [Variovorax sp. WS11]NDZ17726.1 hypothetical protein [Variovorax sp. WS11]